MAPIQWLRAAGVAAVLLSALPAIVRAHHGLDALALALPIALFLVAFLHSLRGATTRAHRRAALLVESASALAFTALTGGGFAAVLVVVVAGQAPFIVGTSAALVVVAWQTVSLAVIYASRTSVAQGIVASGGHLAFQLFAAGTAVLAEREAAARKDLALANAELLVTREAFATTTRTAERLRIARDLHDTMGHRLTALRLQLEVAKHSDDEQRRQAIETAGEVSKLLLDEVREVVSAMRAEAPVDLEAVLAPLVRAVPRPKVTLSIDPAVHVAEPALANAIVRFVQEAVTNAARHANADTLVIALEKDGDLVCATARDDGGGSVPVHEGNGLRGLRERFEALGGRLAIERGEGRGLVLRAVVPAKEGPA